MDVGGPSGGRNADAGGRNPGSNGGRSLSRERLTNLYTGPAPSKRVLIVRCCRADRFRQAVHVARARHPDAAVTALTTAGHRQALLAAGVDAVVELRGSKLSVLGLGLLAAGRLYGQVFTEVIIPQMSADVRAHLNVYTLVATLRTAGVRVLDGQTEVAAHDRRSFRRHLLQELLEMGAERWDTAMCIALVTWACILPRARRRRSRRAGPTRLLYIINTLSIGGAQAQLAAVVNALPVRRYQVDILVLDTFDGTVGREWITRPDVTITYLTRWPNLTLSLQEIVRQCRGKEYDLVHSWQLASNVLGVAAARMAGVPRVITAVRCASAGSRVWSPEGWWRALDVLTSRAADVVTVNARALVADLSRRALLSRSRIHVVYNGLDATSAESDRQGSRERVLRLIGAAANAILIGTAGRLTPEKDQATFLRVLAAVLPDHPSARGVIIGDGRLRRELESVVAQLGLIDRVAFVGDRRDARDVIAGLDVFVLTSVTEGFPNVLLEATLLGVPCVASAVGGNAEVLGPGAMLFPPGDTAACAALVGDTLSNRRAASDRAARAGARAREHFTVEKTVGAWVQLYASDARTPTIIAGSASRRLTSSAETGAS
jgi:glycosyltransferase involved in cell wall biosynthesis